MVAFYPEAFVRRLLPALVAQLALGGRAQAPFTSSNPALPGYQADPELDFSEGRYGIYLTTAANSGGRQFHAWASADLSSRCNEGTEVQRWRISAEALGRHPGAGASGQDGGGRQHPRYFRGRCARATFGTIGRRPG